MRKCDFVPPRASLAFLGIVGTRVDSCHDGIVRHPRVALLAPSRTFQSHGVPFSFQIIEQRPFRPTKSLFGPFWALWGLVWIRVTTELYATREWHFWHLHVPSSLMACHSLSK